jgi:SSS family solute:Na+ symporter
MLSSYDYAVIAVYFIFMLIIGWVFHRSNKSTNEFFRGGGKVLWWIVGATAFMTQFSAWTFTGAASKAYENGFLVLAIFVTNALAFFVNYLFTAHRLRRMRVITMFEGVRKRWSAGNEQFFTWIQLPVGTVTAAIALYSLGVILSSVFGLDIRLTMILAGAVVIFMAVFGGAWAATSGDFMQMLVLMAVTTAAAFLALHHVGGVGGFIDKLPEGSFVWGEPGHSGIIAFWIAALFFGNVVNVNNVSAGYRYLCAKDDHHARKGALLASALFVVGPVLWFIPPMVGRIIFPDLSVVPALQNLDPRHLSDGAYLAVGIAIMPKGMIGLIVTSLFAATISNMDTGLNRNTGIFIRSFYHPVLRRNASDHELMVVSRIATVVFGVVTVLCAFLFYSLKNLSLFQLMQTIAALVTLPIMMPLLLGLMYKRTPPWSGWTTVLVCFVASTIVAYLTNLFGPAAYQHAVGADTPLSGVEQNYVIYGLGVFANVVVGSLWFFGTAFWYNRQSPEYRASVEAFFKDLNTPVIFAEEGVADADGSQYRTLGTLCTIYGGFIGLLVLIPNPAVGRAAFLIVGGVIGGIGLLLLHRSRKIAASLQPH